jgi:predicted phosphoribosyltransferase
VTLGATLTVVGITIAVTAAVAFIVVYFRANLGKSTIDLYRQDNDALRARVKTQDEDLAAKDKAIAERDTKLAEKDAQIRHITDIATGATAITALRTVEEREHKSLLDAFNLLQRTLTSLVQEMRHQRGGGDPDEGT